MASHGKSWIMCIKRIELAELWIKWLGWPSMLGFFLWEGSQLHFWQTPVHIYRRHEKSAGHNCEFFKPTTSSINRHVPFAIFVGFSSFPPWLFHLKMLGSPARWNSFVKLIQASPRPWKWKLRNGSSIRCWALEKTTSCFCLYMIYTYSLKPSSILLLPCFSFFFWEIAFEELSLDFINPIGCQVWQRSAQSFFSPNCFQRILTLCLQTCQSSGMNIYWLKGKNANRRSYCARARWTSWPMGCRCGPWDGNAMRQWLNCSINSPDQSLLEWLRFQICNTIDGLC